VQLCQLTGAGMGCGSCRPEVKAILDSFVNVLKTETKPALAEQ
jgi:ferredoxin-nitrate reductase